MKTYQPLREDEYFREIEAYQRMCNQRASIIGLRGTIEQKGPDQDSFFAIILDYHNGSDLESLFRTEVDFASMAAKKDFWTSLMELLATLNDIHATRQESGELFNG